MTTGAIQTTRSKVVACVVALALLLAGAWTWQKLDDLSKRWVDKPVASAADTAAIERAARADAKAASTRRLADRKRKRTEVAHDAYRAEFDAGRPARSLRARYLALLASYVEAQTAAQAAANQQEAAKSAAAEARQRLASANAHYADRRDRVAFLARAALVALVAAILVALWALRRRRAPALRSR